jgi:hypothetical protein
VRAWLRSGQHDFTDRNGIFSSRDRGFTFGIVAKFVMRATLEGNKAAFQNVRSPARSAAAAAAAAAAARVVSLDRCP